MLIHNVLFLDGIVTYLASIVRSANSFFIVQTTQRKSTYIMLGISINLKISISRDDWFNRD